MNRIILLLAFVILSCDGNKCQETARETEAVNLFQNLLEENGLDLVADVSSSKNLPICLNTKKLIIETSCFEKAKASGIIETKPLEKPLINRSRMCIEKLYKSRLNNRDFFQIKDSLALLNQNECVQNFRIPKFLIKNFIKIQTIKKPDILSGFFTVRSLVGDILPHNPRVRTYRCCFLFRNILFLYDFIIGTFSSSG